MAKHRITLTAVVEFEVNPEAYKRYSTPAQRLEVDLKNAEEDPVFCVEMNAASWTVTGEIVDD